MGVVFPHGLDQPHHPLLQQILVVSAGKKVGSGDATHQPVIPRRQNLLGVAVPQLAGGA